MSNKPQAVVDPVKNSVQALGLDPPLKTIADLPQNVQDVASSTKEMDLSFNDIESLEGLKVFTSLEKLILDNNALTTLSTMPSMPSLRTLWLNKNQIDNSEEMFAVLASKCPGITYLSLMFNPCCPNALIGHADPEYRRFRVYAKHRLPSLGILDSAPITADEAATAAQRGQFMVTTSSTSSAASSPPTSAASASGGSSPSAAASGGSSTAAAGGATVIHVSAPGTLPGGKKTSAELFDELDREVSVQRGEGTLFGIQRHVYTGKSSEGNRFIGNDML